MVVGVAVVMALGVLAIAYGIVKATSVHRTPPELRGDWWGRFERQFRTYASAAQLRDGWTGPERRRRPR